MSFLERFKRKAQEDSAPPKETKPAVKIAETRPATPVATFLPAEPLPRTVETKHDIELELGDFLPRILPQLLHAGPHQAGTKLAFDIGELADRIARGQTSIRLSEIYRRAPEVFREEVLASDETEIRFPWQKVMRMLAGARAVPSSSALPGGLTPEAAAALAEKLRNRRAARNIVPGLGEITGTPEPAEDVPPQAPEGAAASMPAVAAQAAELPPVISAADSDAALHSPLLDDEKLTREELLRARDAMRAQLRRAKGEHERQVKIFAQERQRAVEERQRFVSEMMRLKKEADDAAGQISFQKEVAAKASDSLAKVREANVALGKQVTELSGGKASGRSTKEQQNELTELQQQVASLESSQRDSALELGREKEAKLQLERALATAERTAQENAEKIEGLLLAQKNDFEATQQQRDAEAARTLQDVRQKLTAAHAAREQLIAELESVRTRVVEVPAPAPAAAPAAEAWEGRALEQFEADIENYRERIKALLAERDALTQEKAALHAQLATGVGTNAELSEAHANLTRELETARTTGNATIAVLQTELQKVSAEREAAQQDAGKLLADLKHHTAAWTAERDTLMAELATARQEHEAVTAIHGELHARHGKLESDRGTLAAQLAEAETARASALADAEAARADLERQVRERTAELAELRQTYQTVTTEFHAAKENHAREFAEGTARLSKLQTERAALEAQATEAERELAKLRAKAQQTDVTVAGAEVAIRHHEEAVSKLRDQQAETLAERASEHAAALAELRSAHESALQKLGTGYEEKLRRLTAEIAQLNETVAATQRESTAAAQGVAAASAEADRKFEKFQRERDGLLAERRTLTAELESAKDALKAQAAVFARDLKRAERQRDEALAAAEQAGEREADIPRRKVVEAVATVVPPKGRKSPREESRIPAESAASRPAAEGSARLKIQRVRPVSIRPPQVQTH
ncbi:MAG: hypothetical protein K8R23_07395 [Chthoniobacter sp.]|nr:hypothetical protein [Chthoniobacter sp.]